MRAEDHRAIAAKIGARFHRPWHRSYARNKIRLDPAYSAVATLLGDDRHAIVDIGCGLGLLGFYLRERGCAAHYTGLDFDAAKIATAQRVAAANRLELAFEQGDANRLPPFAGHVVLLDVLHYLHFERQQALLHDAATRVAPGAALIVRSVLRAPGWRFRITVLEEHLIHAMRWMKSPAAHFPTRAEIESPLLTAGLLVDVNPLWGNTPFNSFLIVARRPESGVSNPLPRREASCP